MIADQECFNVLEVEMKFPGADFAALEERLVAWNARPGDWQVEEDHYFKPPDRDFAQTDEALRVRRVGAHNVITYKGPKRQAVGKTRLEVEASLASGDESAQTFLRLLEHLRYQAVLVVRKRRRIFRFDRGGFELHVCLDEVDELGRFAEVEIVASEDREADARSVLTAVVAELGLQGEERRSYLELLLEKRKPRPVVVKTVAELRQWLADVRRRNVTIGLVPTMGALHEGHAALIRTARAQVGFVVVTIFVNPTQFGPKEDLSRYPRPLEADLDVCAREGADLVFVPEPTEVYPPGFCTYVEVQGLQDVLEGLSRPGHFRGVATVVLKLFNMVQPEVAFFGRKDAQQVKIIERMVRDLNVPVKLVICPTVREGDGLALSSRNVYLDAEQRRKAVVVSQALAEAQTLIENGERNSAVVQHQLIRTIRATPGAVLDYAAVVNAETLHRLERLTGRILIALAVRFGSTRLIDNIELEV
jgi:pantoate--beta-alanine ligase